MESIKDNPDFCNTVLYKNIYTVLYHKNRDDIENFTFINYQEDENILDKHTKFNNRGNNRTKK